MGGESVVVGGEDLPVNKLVVTLESINSFVLFRQKWSEVARGLDVSSEIIEKIRSDLLLDKCGLGDAVEKIIAWWVSKNGSGAELRIFNQVLESNGLKGCTDMLTKAFCTDSSGKFLIDEEIENGNELVVGTTYCPITSIVAAFKNFPTIKCEWAWTSFANKLHVSPVMIDKFKQDLILDKANFDEVIRGVIELWIGHCGRNAKLIKVIEALEEDDQSVGVGDKLRLRFNLSCADANNESITWDKLSSGFQAKVNNKIAKIWPEIKFKSDSKLDRILVEKNDCSIRNIIATFQQANYFSEVLEKWSEIAIGLDISFQEIHKIRQNLHLNKRSLVDALDTVLQRWNEQNNNEAILDELIWVLQLNGLNLAAEHLRNKFKPKEDYSVKQEDLNRDIFSKSVLDGALLSDLINGRKPRVFKPTLPPNLTYYINRTLLPRKFISKMVFKADAEDIFLFYGIERNKLSELAKPLGTNTSTDELEFGSITSRFINLDLPSHFQKICGKEKRKNVHLFYYSTQDDKFIWVKSRGKVTLLQKHVKKSQEKLNEREIGNWVVANNLQPLATVAICISDSPGMGKSVLLAEIGRELDKAYSDREVFCIVASEFIQEIRKHLTQENTFDIKTIEKSLQVLTCKDELGKALLNAKLYSKETRIELLLDGFDELCPDDVQFAHKVLEAIVKLVSIRLWVTTRPHCLDELENTLNVLGYHINAFNENEQVLFLTKYWNRLRHAALKTSKLVEYAEKVLASTKPRLNKADQDIAGIPLQCLLFAEVYEDEAIEYAQLENETDQVIYPKIMVNSITDLYKKLIQKKLDKYKNSYKTGNELDLNLLIKIHSNLSLELLFPQYQQATVLDMDTEMGEILKVGLLEASSRIDSPRFIHRTFAEYFVADFIINRLNEIGWSEELTELLLNGIMGREKIELFLLDGNIPTWKFIHQVITYFLNTLLCEQNSPVKFLNFGKAKISFQEISHACAFGNLYHIFKFIFGENIKNGLDKDLILVAVHKSVVKYVSDLFSKYDDRELDLSLKTDSLRLAVQRGDYSIVEFLVNEQGLDLAIKRLESNTRYLIHDCVKGTNYKVGDEIESRIQIIKFLVKTNKFLLEQSDDFGRTPLLSDYAHIDLLTDLILKQRANVFAQDKNNDTILHLSMDGERRRLTQNEYRILLMSILTEDRAKLVKLKGAKGDTPLARLVACIDPGSETLEIFKTSGANFKSGGENGAPVLQVAISAYRNGKTIQDLINFGADVNWKGKNGESHLHLAAQVGNKEAAFVLIKEGLQVNIEDNNNLTPLDYAIQSEKRMNSGKRYECGVALYRVGGQVSKMIKDSSQTQIQNFLKKGNVDSFRLLQPLSQLDNQNENNVMPFSQGCSQDLIGYSSRDLEVEDFDEFNALVKGNFYYKDNFGNSLLHLAILKRNEQAIKHLLENGADVNAKNQSQQTSLHLASLEKENGLSLTFIKLLIHTGVAACQIKDNTNSTFLHLLFDKEEPMTNLQFHSITEYLIGKDFARLFDIHGGINDATPLHLALLNFHPEVKVLNLLHSNSVSFNLVDKDGDTVLKYAIQGGKSQAILSSLINFGAQTAHSNINGDTVLHLAARYGHVEAIKLFCDDSKLIDSSLRKANFWDSNTALHCAAAECKENIFEIIQLLIEKGASISSTNKKNLTPLDLLMKREEHKDNLELIGMLKFGISFLNAPEEIRRTMDKLDDVSSLSPLHRLNGASLHNAIEGIRDMATTIEIIKSLIENGSDVFLKDDEDFTFLHKLLKKEFSISSSQFHNISEFLIKKGHSSLFNEPGGKAGFTPFQLAVAYDRMELEEDTLSLLFSNGVDFNATDTELASSVLDYAINSYTNPRLINLLIQYGADWTYKNKQGVGMLQLAAAKAKGPVVKIFLDLGLDANYSDLSGQTALHFAASIGATENFFEVAQLLLEAGAEVNAKTKHYLQTPLHLVTCLIKSDRLILFKFLIENGADMFAQEAKSNNTFLHSFVMDSTSLQFHALSAYLISKGFYQLFSAKNKDGYSPMHFAILNMQIKLHTLIMLKEGGVDFDSISNNNTSLLEYTIIMKRNSLLKNLVQSGCNWKALNNYKRNLLFIASIAGNVEATDFLLEMGLNPTQTDIHGLCPLFAILFEGRSNVFEIGLCLISNGADLTFKRLGGLARILSVRMEKAFNHFNEVKQLVDVWNGIHSGSDRAIDLSVNLQSNFTTNVQVQPRVGSKTTLEKTTSKAVSKPISVDLGWEVLMHISSDQTADIDTTLHNVKSLISRKVNVFATDKNGRTFLHNLLMNRHVEKKLGGLVEYLASMSSLSLFNIQDVDGNTPLHLALQNYDPDDDSALSILNSNGIDFNTIAKDDHSLLSLAVMHSRSICLIQSLIKFGADWHHCWKGESLLHLAVSKDNLEATEFFLGLGIPPNVTNSEEKTPLHVTAKLITKLNDIEFCKLLVQAGANINARDLNQSTPLHIASERKQKSGSVPIIKYLIDCGADPFAKNNQDKIFLSNLIETTGPDGLSLAELGCFTEYLKEKGCIRLFNISNGPLNYTSLHWAVNNFDLEDKTLSLFHSNGVNFNSLTIHGNSVLTLAVLKKRSIRLIKSLIKFGADLKYVKDGGINLLHIASEAGHLEAIQLFIKHIDVNQSTYQKMTPLHYLVGVCKELTMEALTYLVEAGADLNAKENNGQTILHLACFRKDKDFFSAIQNAIEKGIAGFDKQQLDILSKIVAETPLNTESDLDNLQKYLIENGFSRLFQSNIEDANESIGTVEILKFLIGKGANVFLKDVESCIFLHRFAEKHKITHTDVKELAEYLITKDLGNLFVMPRRDGKTPIQLLNKRFPIENILSLLKTNGVNVENALVESIAKPNTFLNSLVSLANDFVQELGKNNQQSKPKTDLFGIAIKGTLKSIKSILAEPNIDVNQVDADGNTALHLAAEFSKEKLELVKALLRSGADVKLKNKRLETPLHCAALSDVKNSQLETVKYLISHGAEVFEKYDYNFTFLHALLIGSKLTQSEFHDLASYLIERGYKDIFDIPGGPHDQTVFQCALQYLDLHEKTLSLLFSNGINFNAIDGSGDSVLAYAIRNQSSEIISYLILYGADPNHLNNKKQSLLHLICNESATTDICENVHEFDTLQILIAAGSDVNARDEDESTPLHIASTRRNVSLDIIKCLIDNGADVFAKTKLGITFLFKLLATQVKQRNSLTCLHSLTNYLVEKECVQLFQVPNGTYEITSLNFAIGAFEIEPRTLHLLYSKGIDFNSIQADGSSVLSTAVLAKQNIQTLNTLIELGADWKWTKRGGQNLLHHSAQVGHLEAMKLFINLGISVNSATVQDTTPVHYLVRWCENNVIECLNLLIENGADVKAKTMDGQSLLHYASFRRDKDNFVDVVKPLIENGTEVHAKDNDGCTFLHKIVPMPTLSVYHELVKYLFSNVHPKLFNVPGGEDQLTPFQYAVRHLELERRTLLLLQYSGVNFNSEKPGALSVLHAAVAGNRSQKFITQLISCGSDWKVLDTFGNNLLHITAKLGNLDLIPFFINLGLPANSVNYLGMTPLQFALEYSSNNYQVDLKMAEFLLEKGADLNTKDVRAASLLHSTVNRKDSLGIYFILEFLVENGVDVFAKDGEGNTFFQKLARKEEVNEEIDNFATYLIEKGFGELLFVHGVGEKTPLDFLKEKLSLAKTMSLLQNAGINVEGEIDKGSLVNLRKMRKATAKMEMAGSITIENSNAPLTSVLGVEDNKAEGGSTALNLMIQGFTEVLKMAEALVENSSNAIIDNNECHENNFDCEDLDVDFGLD